MATKQIAHGTVFKEDVGSTTTFTAMTLINDIAPPGRSWERIDGKELTDDFAVELVGIEKESELTIKQYWHPGDTAHQKFDTAAAAKTDFPVQIVYPFSTPVTDQFNVKVVALSPESLTVDGTIQRTVTMIRTSDITRT